MGIATSDHQQNAEMWWPASYYGYCNIRTSSKRYVVMACIICLVLEHLNINKKVKCSCMHHMFGVATSEHQQKAEMLWHASFVWWCNIWTSTKSLNDMACIICWVLQHLKIKKKLKLKGEGLHHVWVLHQLNFNKILKCHVLRHIFGVATSEHQ